MMHERVPLDFDSTTRQDRPSFPQAAP